MLIKKITTCMIALVLAVTAQAQASKFNLKEAIDFALKNNPNLVNARIEETIADKKVSEIKAIGLPQVSAGVSYTNYIQIPTQRLPNFINEALPPGSPRGPEFIDAQFGIPHSLGANVTLNQLLFDGTYFLGLKAAQEFVKISQYAT
ncbi:MAG TPA: TolC family protein, partial [Bacteroidia bacterium]|nr:TolC family protein [Bacteroidia bacterium]